MTKLSNEQYNKAKSFIMNNGRKLDQAMFEYEFENGSRENVLAQLQAYQNRDGGFGNGIEPDFRCTESSALGTTIAFQYLTRLHADEHMDLVQQGIIYLLNSLKKGDLYCWEIVPKEVNTAPRAMWWNYQESIPFTGNPNAEIIGYLYAYKALVPPDLLEVLISQILLYIKELKEAEFHELLCFLRMTELLPTSVKEQISDKLANLVERSVTVQPELWHSYCLQPIQVVQSLQSPYYHMFEYIVTTNLDYLVSNQTPEGCWSPTWSWGQFEDSWEFAKREWQGYLTLDYLRILSQHNYIDM